MNRLVEMANRKLSLEAEIAELEGEMKLKQEELRILTENDLPEAMEEEGVIEFTLEDGRKVLIATSYHAAISEANEVSAFRWLRDNGFDAIIKRNVSLEFGRGEDELAAKYVDWLNKHYPDRTFKDKSSVHHSTLKAFVRERIEAGEDIPLDVFGVFVRNYAAIKEVEVKKGRSRAAVS
jgi:hypothetical protein